MPNRFSQIIQPYVVNPIDVNLFAMAPLAKARAKAMGIKAAESYMFDYNIDKKDSEYINPMVKDVTQQKDNIVSRIRTEGVSNDLISDLIQTKRSYDQVSSDVSKAEENKKRIDTWNNKLLVLHKDNTKYMDYVKNKEYERGWSGTFGENGSINTFDASYGPQYFDLEEGFRNILKGLPLELDEALGKKGTGYITTINDPSTGQKRSVFVSSQDEKIYSNKSAVLSQADVLKEKYKDPTTTEGAYAAYVGMTDAEIDQLGTDVANSLIRSDAKGGSVSRRLLEAPPPFMSDAATPGMANTPGNVFDFPKKTNLGQVKTINENNTDKWLQSFGFAGTVIGSGIDRLGKIFGGDQRSDFEKSKDPWYSNYMSTFWDNATKQVAGFVDKDLSSIFGEWSKAWDMSEEQKAKEAADYVFKFSSEYLSNDKINQKFATIDMPIVLDPVEEDLLDRASEFLSDPDLATEDSNEEYVEAVFDYYKNSTYTLNEFSFSQTDSSPLVTLYGVKNAPKDYIGELTSQADMMGGDIVVKNLGTGKLLDLKNDKVLMKQIYDAMDYYSGQREPTEDSYTSMKFKGVGSSDPDLYKVYDANTQLERYDERLAYGAHVQLEDEDGNNLGSYLVGNKASTWKRGYGGRGNTMESMANLKYGEKLNGTYAVKIGPNPEDEQQIPLELERNTAERWGLNSRGQMELIPKDQFMFYVYGELLPRLYNPAHVGFINLESTPVLTGAYNLKAASEANLLNMPEEEFKKYINSVKPIR